MATVPPINLTDHAIDRFRERACPDLDLAAARAKLEEMMVGCPLVEERPFDTCWTKPVDAFLVLGVGLALALRWDRWTPHELTAVTCLTADGLRVRVGR
jgi:hypothetical protein